LAIFKKTISYLPRAQRIIAVSKATKRDLVEKLGVDPEKIVVVYEGVEKKFKITNDELRIFEKEPFHDKKVILHVGNSLEYKNMEGLLKAFAKVVRSEGDVTLVKVGNFTKGQLDLILSLNLKLDLNIFERPGLSEEELVAMYNLATVTCIPSHQEGFGFPVLESLACGAPVVCSNTSSLPEVGGQSALYCNPAKPDSIARKILEVLQMPKPAYQKLSQQGIKHTKKFTWEKCAQETTVVYKQLLNMV